jgi:hypothetical protein
MLKGARMTRYLLIAVLWSSSVPQVAAAAPASSSWTDGKFSAAGLIGYGIGFASPNAYSFGFGGRGGYTFPGNILPVPFYTGVSFLYYIGSSQTVPFFGSGTVHVWALMAEFGPELVFGPVELRPFLGLGIGVFGGGVGAFSSSTAYFGLTPGAVATYSFNGPLSTGPFVGADIHLTWLPSPGAAIANDLSLLATGGYRF